MWTVQSVLALCSSALVDRHLSVRYVTGMCHKVCAIRYVPCFWARIWWVKSLPDSAMAEFKYCKSHLRSRLVESLFSISRLMYRHPILAGSEQKTHFMCYGDGLGEDFNSWDSNGGTSVPLYRDTSVDLSSHMHWCHWKCSTSMLLPPLFPSLYRVKTVGPNWTRGMSCDRYLFPQTTVIRNWQQILLSPRLDKILNSESFNIFY